LYFVYTKLKLELKPASYEVTNGNCCTHP